MVKLFSIAPIFFSPLLLFFPAVDFFLMVSLDPFSALFSFFSLLSRIVGLWAICGIGDREESHRVVADPLRRRLGRRAFVGSG